jgi:CheY-like chemotaxis protein
MQKIIGHLRKFSSDTSKDQRVVLDLNDPIRDSLILHNSALTLKNIEVRLELRENLPLVLADHNELETVFHNLISNSFDAFVERRPQSGPKFIEISTSTRGQNVVAEFKDNAGGIPDSIRERIFDPFFTTKEVGKGTGLGLSIAHRIITELRGKISVLSSTDEGVTFEIVVPIAPTYVKASEISNTESSRASGASESPEPKLLKSVLVVDDEEAILELLFAYLSTHFNVTTSLNPIDALQMASLTKFDLIITDMRMPQMDGSELITAIRSSGRQTPIAVVTGHAFSGDEVKKLLQLGANAVIPKPLPKIDDLLLTLNQLILPSAQVTPRTEG